MVSLTQCLTEAYRQYRGLVELGGIDVFAQERKFL